MKPAPFAYVAPATLEEALALVGDHSRPLAGGQSLVPLLNARRVRPQRLVDLNRLQGHDYLREEEGWLRIGMLVRQAELLELEHWPLLRAAVSRTGHPATRTRGTVCGSVANGDRRSELPAALTALAARVHVRSAAAARETTVPELHLAPDELIVELEVPPHPASWRFYEYTATHGDWPQVGVAAAGANVVPFGRGLETPWAQALIAEALA